ncbi:MAG TPA: cyclase family protein [Pyrinomonadaceae bacterium]|jgi:kynurenine formamidase|nr:cyclase family protein [Pyrinomonadaceae bacterium]
MSKTTFIDLSHTIEDGMITYKGLPAPVFSDYLSREQSRERYGPGTEFHIGKLEMIANTGTYIDSPFHRYADGKDLAGFELDVLANLDGLVIRHVGAAERELEQSKFPEMMFTPELALNRAITDADIRQFEVRNKAVLFHTGWDMRWRTDDYANGRHPFLTEAAAEYLASEGAALVGIDSLNIDDTATGARPVHTTLLKHGIPIVEHLCGLRELPDNGFRFFAVPPKLKKFGSFPVRAFAILV